MPKLVKLSRKEWTARAAKIKKAAEAKAFRRDKLILDHTHVVVKLADQVHRKMTHVDKEDLYQAGFVGLCEAADRYKPRTGPFENFCYFRVRGAMIDAHKRAAYRDDTMFIHSIDEVREHSDDSSHFVLPKMVAADLRPLPDAMAAQREQARLLSEAVNELDPDEQMVFRATLARIPLLTTALNCGRSVAWARAKLASARAKLGAKVQMWGLGLDKAA